MQCREGVGLLGVEFGQQGWSLSTTYAEQGGLDECHRLGGPSLTGGL